MSTRITRPVRGIKEDTLETTIFTLQDFMTYTKGITYLIMGGILVFMPLFWKFLTDREDE